MLLGISWGEWLTVGGVVVVFVTGTAIPVFIKLKKVWTEKGASGAAAAIPGVLIEHRDSIGKLYKQISAVVRAVDTKEEAISDLIEKLPDEIKKGALGDALKKMSLGDAKELSSLDLAKIPFKDIVNSNLVKSGDTNDALLKSLVESARSEESTNVAIDKVASTLGGIAGEGLNLASKIATGGTVSAKDVVGFLSGVGSSALGAKDSST